MSRICKVIISVFALCYGLALILLLIGTFGSSPDPLSGVYLIPLGLPWNRFIDWTPEVMWPWLAAAAPLVNLVLIFAICRTLRRGRS